MLCALDVGHIKRIDSSASYDVEQARLVTIEGAGDRISATTMVRKRARSNTMNNIVICDSILESFQDDGSHTTRPAISIGLIVERVTVSYTKNQLAVLHRYSVQESALPFVVRK